MQQQPQKLIEDIVNDYAVWQGNCSSPDSDNSDISKRMFEEFKDGIGYS